MIGGVLDVLLFNLRPAGIREARRLRGASARVNPAPNRGLAAAEK